jgi:VIT family.
MGLSDYIGRYWVGAEAIYAVILAMTFTSVLRTYIATSDASHFPLVYSALFCCVAWGIADGSFYVWERKYNLRMENDIIDMCRSKREKDAAISLIHEQLGNTILSNIAADKRQKLYGDLVVHLAAAGKKEAVSAGDILNIILGTTLVSTVAGLTVILPFFLIEDMYFALTISNWLGISLLFVIGYYRTYEKDLFERLRSGFITAVIGMMIAAITVMLGG